MRGMETTTNAPAETTATTADEARTEILLDPALTVLEEPISLLTAIKAMDKDGWLTVGVPVGL